MDLRGLLLKGGRERTRERKGKEGRGWKGKGVQGKGGEEM